MHSWVARQGDRILALLLSTASFVVIASKVQAAEPIQQIEPESQTIEPESSLNTLREAQVLYQQAMDLAEEKRYSEAIEVASRSLQLRQDTWGELHKEVLDSLLLVAELNRIARNHERAEELFGQALPLSREIWGETSPVTASVLYSLGVLQLHQGDADEAKAMLMESLEIRREVLPQHSPYLVATLYSVGVMYVEKSNYSEAENILEEALELAEKHSNSVENRQVSSISVLLRRVRRLVQQHPTIASM